jgi:hypothetical protein
MPAFLHHPLAREIALVIAVKLALIAVIFYAFFAGRAVPTDPASVADRLVNSSSAPHPHSTSGSSHAD